MPSQWRIEYWPDCIAHVLLSHCAEDRDHLVLPVYEELRRRGLVPWIDRHDYPIGRDAMEALREELLKCRHVVYFLTSAMLWQGRGWASTERALSAVIQQRLRYFDAEIAHVELPLVFLPPDHAIFHRSVWRSLADKAERCPHAVPARRLPENTWQPKHVQWAADVVESFVRQEERWAIELGIRFDQDTRLSEHFSGEDNLMRRVLAQAPRSWPVV